MDRKRTRFYTALGLFVAWVLALGVLAAISGRRPVSKERPVARVGP